jgi:hypothetical protein
MTLDIATEEYIKKHFFIKDGKLYRLAYGTQEIKFNNTSFQLVINTKKYSKRKIFEYLQTGKWKDEQINNNSGYTGVCYSKFHKKWIVRITRNRYVIFFKTTYKTKEEAIEAYNKALDEYNNKQEKEGEQ